MRGRKLEKSPEEVEPPRWDFTGAPIAMPGAYPMAEVPEGGWAKDPENAPTVAVEAVLDEFNAHYSSMLRSLEAAWRTTAREEGTALVGRAIKSMGALRTLARVLMRIPLPAAPRMTYGPEFLYVEREP